MSILFKGVVHTVPTDNGEFGLVLSETGELVSLPYYVQRRAAVREGDTVIFRTRIEAGRQQVSFAMRT